MKISKITKYVQNTEYFFSSKYLNWTIFYVDFYIIFNSGF